MPLQSHTLGLTNEKQDRQMLRQAGIHVILSRKIFGSGEEGVCEVEFKGDNGTGGVISNTGGFRGDGPAMGGMFIKILGSIFYMMVLKICLCVCNNK